jgi:hypothetical protein
VQLSSDSVVNRLIAMHLSVLDALCSSVITLEVVVGARQAAYAW